MKKSFISVIAVIQLNSFHTGEMYDISTYRIQINGPFLERIKTARNSANKSHQMRIQTINQAKGENFKENLSLLVSFKLLKKPCIIESATLKYQRFSYSDIFPVQRNYYFHRTHKVTFYLLLCIKLFLCIYVFSTKFILFVLCTH